MTLNRKAEGTELYEIEFTPKGTTERKTVYVYAKNRLDASNFMIINEIWGKQHKITIHSSNLIK